MKDDRNEYKAWKYVGEEENTEEMESTLRDYKSRRKRFCREHLASCNTCHTYYLFCGPLVPNYPTELFWKQSPVYGPTHKHTHTHTHINAGENILPRFRGDKNHSGVEPFGIAMPCGLNMIVFSPKFKHRSEHKHTVHLFLTVDSETDLLSEYASNVLGYTKVASGVAGVCSWDNQRPRVVDEVLVTRAEQVDDGVVLSPADDRAGIADDIAGKNNVFASDRRQHAGSLLARPRRNCQRQHTSSFIHLFIYCKSKSKKVNNV